jgi:hypothetical protein
MTSDNNQNDDDSEDSKHEDLRKFPRFNSATKAQVRQVGLPDWNHCEIVNLSKGGAKILTMVTYPVGTIIEILVLSPDPAIRQHQIMARVVWSQTTRCGLEFITRL